MLRHGSGILLIDIEGSDLHVDHSGLNVSVPHKLHERGQANTGAHHIGGKRMADERYEPAIAERFRKWPEAAITYFGILVSPCKQRIQLPDAKVMVVKDRTLGTNDCRGWISRSVFERFHLPGHRLYQFRLAFENTQAKGACKVMPDDVAQKLGADIILPESCVKPEYKQSTRFLDFLHWRRPKIEVRTYRGPVVFGIREVSRTLDLHSSYTLIEHAPWESVQLEIAPFAMEQARKLRLARMATTMKSSSSWVRPTHKLHGKRRPTRNTPHSSTPLSRLCSKWIRVATSSNTLTSTTH